MDNKINDDIITQLSNSISDDVGNTHEDELESISSSFNKSLDSALKAFNSSSFDDDGFVKRLRDMDLGDSKDKSTINNILNNLKNDYIAGKSVNSSELLLKRDIESICKQMPEMRDVISVIRDSIIECNVSTGEVSRSLLFENYQDDENLESQVKDLEKKHNLLMAIKNFIIPNTLRTGEMYIHCIPYAKIFAELEMAKDTKSGAYKENTIFRESIPNVLKESFNEPISLYNEDNLEILTESVSVETTADVRNINNIEKSNFQLAKSNNKNINKEELSSILKNINVQIGSSELLTEMGIDGCEEFIKEEYIKERKGESIISETDEQIYFESNYRNSLSSNIFNNVDQDDVNIDSFTEIKGCYVKYLDPLKVTPIRMDRKVIGYLYATTSIDLQTNQGNPSGVVDLSYQNYTSDKNVVDRLAEMIIKSFDKKMLSKNIKLKNEICEILMAHKFSEGRLSFIYIPENEVIRLIINEDENGKGHSVLEPSLFPARNYLLLSLYNMLYILNNTTTRIHYLKSSGLNKDYAAQIQRTMRKFQSRRITVDDIYSYSGALNKVGGIGQMIIPTGKNDYKALETDTIEASNPPLNVEFLEQQRRQALTGTGVPQLLVINAIDEVDFAKTLEMANTRFLSTVSSYKIDCNAGITKLYQILLKYSTDIKDDIIKSFKFIFNPVKQQELNITADMINNFNDLCDLVGSLYYKQTQIKDQDGNPTPIMIHLRKELAKKYLPQLDFDEIDDIINKVNVDNVDDQLQDKVSAANITNEDLKEVDNK